MIKILEEDFSIYCKIPINRNLTKAKYFNEYIKILMLESKYDYLMTQQLTIENLHFIQNIHT